MSGYRSEQRIQTVCLLILAGTAIGAALEWLQPVVVPFVLALFLRLVLDPVVAFQRDRLRVPGAVAVVTTLFLGIAAFFLIGGTLAGAVSEFSANAGRYQAGLENLVDRVLRAVPLQVLGIEPGAQMDVMSLVPVGATRTVLMQVSGSLFAILSKTTLVFLFLLFLLVGSAGPRAPLTGIQAEVDSRVKRYVVAKVFVSALTGLLVYAILSVLDVDFARSFGAFAFLLNFIPNVGSVISSLLPLPVVLLAPDVTALRVVLAIGVPALVQFVIGNIVEPRLMGGSLDLHPITILLALIFWGMIWGVVGMFLAVPITAVVKLALERIEITAPVAELLAGRRPY